jgi:hypothetical protein
MQSAAALECPAMGHRRIELRKLSFQPLIDQKEGLERAAYIAVTGSHDFVDGGFIRSGTHQVLQCVLALFCKNLGVILAAGPRPLWIVWIAPTATAFSTGRPRNKAKVLSAGEHDPEKWEPAFPRDKTPSVCPEIMLKQKDEIMIRFNPIGS